MNVFVYPIISSNLESLEIPGVQLEIAPTDAELLGAFAETALSENDAWEANVDIEEMTHDPQ